MTDSRRVGMILDTTAVLVFAEGSQRSIHVGEPLTEAEDNGEVLGIPLPCLVEAARRSSSDLLGMLAASGAVRVLPGVPETYRALASMWDLLGDYPQASAALYAVDLDVLVLTARPDAYRLVRAGGIVNPIPETDD